MEINGKKYTNEEYMKLKRECQHEWEELVDKFLTPCYRQCKKCQHLEKLPDYE